MFVLKDSILKNNVTKLFLDNELVTDLKDMNSVICVCKYIVHI